MKSDEDVRMISAEAPVLFARACEFFIQELTTRSWSAAQEFKRRTLQRSDVATAISRTGVCVCGWGSAVLGLGVWNSTIWPILHLSGLVSSPPAAGMLKHMHTHAHITNITLARVHTLPAPHLQTYSTSW
jgi:hypothetical protein